MAAAFPALVREVPELRSTLLRHRLFLGGSTRVGLYVATVAYMLRRRRLAAGAVGWWVAAHARTLRGAPWPHRLWTLPLALALDALTGAALVTGSLRARSVTL
jgi:hypothetical protein